MKLKKLVRASLGIIGGLMVLTFIFGDHGILQLYKLKREKTKIQDHIIELREEKEELFLEKHRLENDLGYIEKLAEVSNGKAGRKSAKVIYDEEDAE